MVHRLILTREELEGQRIRVLHKLATLRNLPTEDELLQELADIEFLLGET